MSYTNSVYLLRCHVYTPPKVLGIFSTRAKALEWLRRHKGSMTAGERAACDVELWLVDAE